MIGRQEHEDPLILPGAIVRAAITGTAPVSTSNAKHTNGTAGVGEQHTLWLVGISSSCC
jgi:hypothetical protein